MEKFIKLVHNAVILMIYAEVIVLIFLLVILTWEGEICLVGAVVGVIGVIVICRHRAQGNKKGDRQDVNEATEDENDQDEEADDKSGSRQGEDIIAEKHQECRVQGGEEAIKSDIPSENVEEKKAGVSKKNENNTSVKIQEEEYNNRAAEVTVVDKEPVNVIRINFENSDLKESADSADAGLKLRWYKMRKGIYDIVIVDSGYRLRPAQFLVGDCVDQHIWDLFDSYNIGYFFEKKIDFEKCIKRIVPAEVNVEYLEDNEEKGIIVLRKKGIIETE